MVDTENYQNMRRKVYGGGASGDNLVFLPICEQCGRFVKADDCVYSNDWEGLKKQPNATCSKHGRVEMVFEGFFSDDELSEED